MIYIFSNIYRFADDKEFLAALEESKFSSTDKFIFLNKCIPLLHGMDFFSNYHVVILNRRKGVASKWHGYEQTRYLQISQCTRLRPDDRGNVIDERGTTIYRIPFEEYPKGKIPTTGYFAYKLMQLMFPQERQILVNFYGSADNSTPKAKCHAWAYEDVFFSKIKERVFLDGRK